MANEYCPNVTTKYYSYVVEKERLGLWENLSSSSTSALTTYCTEHNASNTGSSNNKPATDSAPTITLNGDSNMTLNIGDSYTERGATAKDEKDGDISNKITISGTVNTSRAGTYTVTYSVTNSNGKSSTVKRIIVVKDTSSSSNENTSSSNTSNTTPSDNTSSGGNKNQTQGNTTNVTE